MLGKRVKYNKEFKVYYSKSGLKKLHKLYEANFNKIVKYDDDKYREIERKLNALQVSIMNYLGMDRMSCPVNDLPQCNECTGYYVKKNKIYGCENKINKPFNKKILRGMLHNYFGYDESFNLNILTKGIRYDILNDIDKNC